MKVSGQSTVFWGILFLKSYLGCWFTPGYQILLIYWHLQFVDGVVLSKFSHHPLPWFIGGQQILMLVITFNNKENNELNMIKYKVGPVAIDTGHNQNTGIELVLQTNIFVNTKTCRTNSDLIKKNWKLLLWIFFIASDFNRWSFSSRNIYVYNKFFFRSYFQVY